MVRGSRLAGRSALELQMTNLTGPPGTAVRVGRMASWVATRDSDSRPLIGTGVFCFPAGGKLGGTARKEKLVPKESFSFCVFFPLP